MKRHYFIFAHREDGTQYVGMDHGAQSLYCSDYRRTLAYKHIVDTPTAKLCVAGHVPAHHYTVQAAVEYDNYYGPLKVVETIRK